MDLYQDGQLSDDALAHYGVKGMKWGVRRSDKQLKKAAKAQKQEDKKIVKVSKTEPVTKSTVERKSGDDSVTVYSAPRQGVLATRDGKALQISDDAVMAAAIQQVARTNSIAALSNQDLEVITKRLNLEVNYNNAIAKRYPTPTRKRNRVFKKVGDAGKKFIQDEMRDLRSGKDGLTKPFINTTKDAAKRAARKRRAQKAAKLAAPVLMKTGSNIVKSKVLKG